MPDAAQTTPAFDPDKIATAEDIIGACAAAGPALEAIIYERLNGYTPTCSDWPWDVRMQPPPPDPDSSYSEPPVYLHIYGTAGPLKAPAGSKAFSFAFTITVMEMPDLIPEL